MKLTKIIVLVISLFLISCKHDNPIESYSKRIIFYENFNNPLGWAVLPYASDTGCVHFKDSMLKLEFDQTLNNCGCAWIAAEFNNPNIYETSFLNKIGVRIKLNKGYFQEIERFYDTIINGTLSQSGEVILQSKFHLYFNSFWIEFPNYNYGIVHRDSTLNINLNKLIGKEFEIIYDEGNRFLNIDGIDYSADNFFLNYQNHPNHNLYMKFELGHLPEISPRKDTLYVDEIEIYTWTGSFK